MSKFLYSHENFSRFIDTNVYISLLKSWKTNTPLELPDTVWKEFRRWCDDPAWKLYGHDHTGEAHLEMKSMITKRMNEVHSFRDH